MAALPVLPPRPPATAAPIRNRAQYADGDNSNGTQAHAYQTVRQMWGQVGGYFGPKAKLPPVSLDQPIYGSAYANTHPHSLWAGTTNDGAVTIGRPMQQALADQQDPTRDYALGAIVHELAHAFQNPRTLRNEQAREGGADAFNRAVSPGAIAAALLGNPASVQPGAHGYDAYVAKALAAPLWVAHGQFR